jgi:hypothetical protein
MPNRTRLMLPIANFMPCLPGLSGMAGSLKTYAPSPVWRDSTTKKMRFTPLPQKQAVRLYHKARKFERQTRQPGRQDGAIGRNGLAVLHALLFDFLNYDSGRLDPSYAKIAKAACISLRSAARGLKNLKAAGVVHWLRRCIEKWENGRFCLEQETNAYGIVPASQWLGFNDRPEAPPPQPGTWGEHPPLDIMAEVAADSAAGSTKAAIGVLRAAAEFGGDAVAGALAGLFGPLFEAQ